MRLKIIFLVLITTICSFSWSQTAFRFQNNRKKVVIPFKLINNLIFFSVKVNGVDLNFLLDSGSNETVLFSLEDKDDLKFKAIEKIKLKGLGQNNFIDGLKSSNNQLSINGYYDDHHELYVVLDQDFNFSAQVGIPVNGIIGNYFFKNNLVEINFEKNKIFVYNDEEKIRKKIKKYASNDISIEYGKPYVSSKIVIENKEVSSKMLIDTGNSDALWLFLNKESGINLPKNNFDDYLGHGFSGEVYGKRARISKFILNNFQFNNPLVAFPDSTAIKKLDFVTDRIGSIGSDILKRFNIIFDYSNNKIYFKKNGNYDLAFNFNMSGIEIEHDGFQIFKEKTEVVNIGFAKKQINVLDDRPDNIKYDLVLKPIFKIASVRKNSPAELCGLKKDDIIIKINKQEVSKLSLQEINELLKSEEGKWISIEIIRNGQNSKFKFQLKSIL